MTVQFRLMTANLLHQRLDAADFAAVLEATAPDVIVTQELGPEAAAILRSAFRNHRLLPSLDVTGRGIATNLEVEFGDIEMPARNGTSAVLELGDARLRLAGVHLTNPVNFPWWTSAANRRRELDSLFQWLRSSEGPVVVAGDFNASPRWPAYRLVAGELNDLVLAEAMMRGADSQRTWSWRPGWPRLLRIDHIFGSGVVARRVDVLPVRGTDHWAVVADLEVP